MTETAPAIEMWPIEKPVPYEGNPRKLTEKAISKVAASIREFGFRSPIIVDTQGIIIAGHTRLQAAKSLKMRKVPVLVADMSPEKAKAYRLADNRVAQETTWDNDLLVAELGLLEGIGFDLDLTGFDVGELERLLDPMAGLEGSGEEFGEVDPDEMETAYCCPKCGYEWSGKPK